MMSLPTSMPSTGRSEMKMASSRTMRTCIDDEKLLPAFSLMLPPVCIVCQPPNVAMMVSAGLTVLVVVVALWLVVSG